MKNLLIEKTVYPNAKLNLYLEIIGRREDGYHLLETIMTPIPLSDEMEIKLYKKGDIEVETLGLNLKKEDNLVYKVLKSIKETFNIDFGIEIKLKKNIPSQAGLGGGSSDAAFIIKFINEIFHFTDLDGLLKFSVKFGADIPFFIINKPSFCQGIGEIITPIEIPKMEFSLYTPKYSISTVKIFQNRDKFIRKENLFGKSLIKTDKDIQNIWNILEKEDKKYFNRLEDTLRKMEPELFNPKNGFSNDYHLTGSGSTFYKVVTL